MIRRISRQIRDLQRLVQIAHVLSRYGLGHVLGLLPLDRSVLSVIARKGPMKHLPSSDTPLPERLRHAAEELGPTFIKLAQLLSTRPDLVPTAFCEEFEHLQDNVAPFAYAEVRELVRTELGRPPEELFQSFAPEPFAAASLSQVHAATCFDGAVVAIKIQRPDIRGKIDSDLEILAYLAGLLDRYVEETRAYNLPQIVEEFTRSIRRELDFSKEAKNIRRFRKNFAETPFVYTPKVYDDFCTQKILTTEKLNGIKVSKIDALKSGNHDLVLLARNGCRAVLKQIFEFGFFHADPHPGNIFVLRGDIIAFIDYGMVGRIDEWSLYRVTDLLNALVERDLEGILKSMVAMGIMSDLYELRDLRADLDIFIDQIHDVPLKNLEIGKLFTDFMEIQRRHHLKLPANLTLLFKSIITIENVGRDLDPDLQLVQEAQPFIKQLMARRYHPENIAREIRNLVVDYLTLTRDLPGEARQIFTRIKEGKLKIELEHGGLEKPLQGFTQASNRVSMAIVLASMIIGSSLIVLSDIPPKVYSIPVIGIVGFLSAGFLGIWLLYSILRHGRM